MQLNANGTRVECPKLFSKGQALVLCQTELAQHNKLKLHRRYR